MFKSRKSASVSSVFIGSPRLPDMNRENVSCPMSVALLIAYRLIPQSLIARRIWSLNFVRRFAMIYQYTPMLCNMSSIILTGLPGAFVNRLSVHETFGLVLATRFIAVVRCHDCLRAKPLLIEDLLPLLPSENR